MMISGGLLLFLFFFCVPFALSCVGVVWALWCSKSGWVLFGLSVLGGGIGAVLTPLVFRPRPEQFGEMLMFGVRIGTAEGVAIAFVALAARAINRRSKTKAK